ncbi:hypothetical protein ACNKHV_13300 [Shigella flexneri]
MSFSKSVELHDKVMALSEHKTLSISEVITRNLPLFLPLVALT